ncbi:threonine/serine ThrE exporter family protein [Streptomyces sp. 8L]|uniref:threonine/serine ThrE exporter family protein n=1 Tax=Streptomyces sp. 8L TaxID=2877242 RepID=UPI001CD44078|nr:threonine/serine exporter family protein [Streptomyces sp. 8L]MCA1224185.1 threonine/serine exporter family protein [Streptomyces sp. 8L]
MLQKRWEATRARQSRLQWLRQDDRTLLDRLYGTPFEDVVFPPARTMEDAEAVDVLDFALRLGRSLFLAGAQTRRIESSVVAVTAAWGMASQEVEINARSLLVQYAPKGRRPVVMLRVVGSDDNRDLMRLTALERLTTKIASGQLSREAAHRALGQIETGARRWPWWFALSGGAVLAAMLCVLASGTLRAATVSPVTFLLVDRGGWALSRSGVPPFFVTAAKTSLLVTLVQALVAAHVLSRPEAASVIAANVILLLPIFTVVSLTEDAINGFSSMAAGRAVSLLSFLTALACGFLAVSFLLLGTDTDARSTALVPLPVVLTLLTSAIGALGNTVFMDGGLRLIPPAIGVAVLGAGAKLTVLNALGWSVILATGIATVLMGLVSTVLAPSTDIPARAVVVPGIAGGVLPGPDLYRSLLQWLLDVKGAGAYLVSTMMSVAAIGIGVVLGTLLGSAAGRLRHHLRLVPTEAPD